MTERKHPLARCEDCTLQDIGAYVPTKFPVGDASSIEVGVVGEAPGFQEASFGQPFIGPSGKLLDKVLDFHGLDRKEILLTNVVACRPPSNEKPDKVAVACCSGRLKSELEPVHKILSLGATASQHLLQNKEAITSARVGPRRQARLVDAEIVPTVHPAYCLRNGDAFPDLVTDVGKLFAVAKPWTPPEYLVADNEEDALVLLVQLADPKYDRLVVDIECGIDKDNSFDHPNRYQMLCVGLGYAKGKVLVIGEEAYKSAKVREALAVLLKMKKIVCQNGKFDLAGVYPTLGDIKLWFDTMLAHYVLDERAGGHGLDTLGIELLGTPNWKNAIKKYLTNGTNYNQIPRPILYKYNANDCAVTWELMELFEEKLEQPVADPSRTMPRFKKLRDVHDFLVEASNELKFLELNGMTINKVYSAELSDAYVAIMADMEIELDDLLTKEYDKRGGINPRSPKQVKEYLHDEGIRVASTDKETLAAVLERIGDGSPVGQFVSKLLEHRRKAKLHGTFIKGIRNRTYRGRIYTTYLLHGTTSGRLASRNPNLQNIVREKSIREQFTVGRQGNVLIQCDFKQAEGRVMCTEAQDGDLQRLFADPDIDIFDDLGFRLYNIPKPDKEKRIRTKAFFYGIGYGRTAYSLAKEYKWDTKTAEYEFQRFKDLIPGVVQWQEDTQQRVLNGEDLTTAFGRSRRFMLITKENRDDVLKEALSFVPQSTSSDICLAALIRLRPMLRGTAWFRLTIHDALVAECAEKDKEFVAATMRRVMLEEAAKYTTYVPFEVDTSYGTHWGEL